jgi:hypothetical protein
MTRANVHHPLIKNEAFLVLHSLPPVALMASTGYMIGNTVCGAGCGRTHYLTGGLALSGARQASNPH